MDEESAVKIWTIHAGPLVTTFFLVPILMGMRLPLAAAVACAVAFIVVLRYWWYRQLLWLPTLASLVGELIWAVVVLVRSVFASP